MINSKGIREAQLIAREKQIIKLGNQLYRQQKMLANLIQKLSANNAVKYGDLPTIADVLKRFRAKFAPDSEEATRKYRAICRYTNIIGLHLADKYSQLHNVKSISQIFKCIVDRTDIHGDQKIRHMRWVTEFARFATCAYPDIYKTDVLTGAPRVKRTPKSEKYPHTPYTDSQLKRIFNPKLNFFCQYPELFWGCMIALFTGSRKNAVFTLQYKDIVRVDGIWCINFIQDYPGIKKLKTEDSERIVPIHSALINMGFLNYVFGKPHVASTDFLFKNVCITSKKTLDTHMTRKLFAFLEQIGIRNAGAGRYDFHSFRKNANIAMEKCGIIRSYIDKIIGWQSRGSEGERSYSNYTVRQLSEQLEKLNYKCLKSEFKQWKKIMTNAGVC